MKQRLHTTSRHTRAFTLIELLVSIFVIGILIGLLVVGMRHAFALAKSAASTQDVAALKVAVQTFKNDFGFLPPLVQDGYTGTPDETGPLDPSGRRNMPNVYSLADSVEREFLQDATQAEDYRFSTYSLAYYIMGALDKSIDGVEGPGARKPTRAGAFDFLNNETYGPLFEPKTGQVVFAPWGSGDGPDTGRFELQDRNGVAYRYYRWQQGDPTDPDRKGVLNVPELVEAGADSTELGNAEYAIVAAGADGVFGDIPIETIDEIEDARGTRFETEAEAEAAARADNTVEVGR